MLEELVALIGSALITTAGSPIILGLIVLIMFVATIVLVGRVSGELLIVLMGSLIMLLSSDGVGILPSYLFILSIFIIAGAFSIALLRAIGKR